MEIKGISRKQAGVIYANVKRGTIEMSREAVSEMYDRFVGEVFVGASDPTGQIAALRVAIDFIFAGEYENAQAAIDRFAA